MNVSDERPELREQYRLSIDEYRFQVDLNWRRSEYFFVLNIGVLVAGTTLLASSAVPRALVGLVFLLGVLLAFLSFLANGTQSGYYHAARDLKNELEGKLSLGKLALTTTPGMGSGVGRLGRVGTFLKTMLVAIALVDLVGAGISFSDAANQKPTPKQVIIRVADPVAHGSVFVVATPDGEVVGARVKPTQALARPFELTPGRYQFWLASAQICSQPIVVSSAPLQEIDVRCP